MYSIQQDLADRFRYNDRANGMVLEIMKTMPAPGEAIRFFSHLISSQDKWMARLTGDPRHLTMQWFEQPLSYHQLAGEWRRSCDAWLQYLLERDEGALWMPLHYTTADGTAYHFSSVEVATQLCFHSVHHRAQMVLLMRQQGIAPPATDYIYWALDKQSLPG